MCRLLFYLGRPILLSELIVEPSNSLIHQSIHCRSDETPVNGDGFGVAWYVPDVSPEPGLFRSLLPAWSNNNLPRLARVTRSGCILAHVRAASAGSSSSENNCHPFTHGPYSFAHNGDVTCFRAIRRSLLERLSEESWQLISGTTDTEHLFAVFLEKLGGRRGAEALARAMEETVRLVLELAHNAGVENSDTYLNLVATDGECGVACRFSTGKPEHTPTLHTYRGFQYSCENGRRRLVRVDDDKGCAVVCSEPLTEDAVWEPIPHNHLVLLHSAQRVHVRPLVV